MQQRRPQSTDIAELKGLQAMKRYHSRHRQTKCGQELKRGAEGTTVLRVHKKREKSLNGFLVPRNAIKGVSPKTGETGYKLKNGGEGA